jgi:hypothetical protein
MLLKSRATYPCASAEPMSASDKSHSPTPTRYTVQYTVPAPRNTPCKYTVQYTMPALPSEEGLLLTLMGWSPNAAPRHCWVVRQ